jgi:hypothetical protein
MEKTIVKPKHLIKSKKYRLKILKGMLFSVILISISLGLGMLGYHFICQLSWVDSLLNASMILTGMGPVNLITNPEGKIFASFYALFSGIAFLTIFAVYFSPIFHNFLHRFHLELGDEKQQD